LRAGFIVHGGRRVFTTVGLGRYAPGTVTGLLLFIPLRAVVLRASSARLSGAVLTRAVLFGVLLNGLVSLLAFL